MTTTLAERRADRAVAPVGRPSNANPAWVRPAPDGAVSLRGDRPLQRAHELPAPGGASGGVDAASGGVHPRRDEPGGSPTTEGASAAPPGTRTYKIKSGDTLVGIAAKFGTTPKAIAKLNGLTNPAALKVGQTLKIP